MIEPGTVYLVGAGPGDPGLITVRGLEVVREGEVIIHDHLISPSLLAMARPGARLVYVGKEAGRAVMSQEDISQLLIGEARAGRSVVRLKGGDPFVFGRGGEEAEALAAAGVPFVVVPGVSSAIAAPAYAGIPVTDRRFASSVAFIAGHQDPSKDASAVNWAALATGVDTLVFLMGVKTLPAIARALLAHGRAPDSPTAVIQKGTTQEQRVMVAPLAQIAEAAEEAGITAPAITVVGQVVSLREALRWFDNRPLFGRRIVVTRARAQASDLAEALARHGAVPVECPVIRIAPPETFAPLDSVLSRIAEFDWLIFTSVNGVKVVLDRLESLGKDVRALAGPRLCAIGPATAEELRRARLRVSVVPDVFTQEGVVKSFSDLQVRERQIAILRAEEARELLPQALEEMGAHVTVVPVYLTIADEEGASGLRDTIAGGQIDAITFTSTSTVRNFFSATGLEPESLAGIPVGCIGPVTAQAARAVGLKVEVVAKDYTIPGLVQAVVDYFSAAQTHTKEAPP